LPYTWNGNIYNAAGTYKDTLISAAGCDSIVTLTLTVKTAVTGAQAVTICTKQLPYIWNGNTYNAAGTYKDTLTNAAGCDSIVTLTLTVKPNVTGSQTVNICNNQLPYTWNGNIYNAAGTYKDTLVSAAGCDSIVTLTLTVKSTVTGAQAVSICNNQLPYTWHGNTYNIAGTYKDTLISASGCDSIVTLTLTVKTAVTGAQAITICNNQLPYNWNGNIYNAAGTYKDTLVSTAGCDSIITLTLTVKPAVTGAQAITICNNQLPYNWNGNIYNAAGTYKDTLVSTAGCDSIVTLTLTVKPVVTGSQTVAICNNQLPYTWNGNIYNAAGTYKDTLISISGCDSIVTLTLTVKTSVTGSQVVTICTNQLPYSWNGNIYNAAGTYKDTLISASGCDSIVTLTLTVKPVVTGSQIIAICTNQLPYTWNGNIYNTAGTYKDTLISASGCDSIVTLTLTVKTTVTGVQTITICNNQLPYNWNGNIYNATGTYKDTLISAAGCDSIVTLTLTVKPAATGAQAVTICTNQLPYSWNGNVYNTAGTYKDTLVSTSSCDSIVTLTLTVKPNVIGSQTVNICTNQLPYTWNGNIYNAAGTYKDTLVSVVGCDSIVTLTLTVKTSVTGTQTVVICTNQLPYTWNGNIYNTAGTYKDTLTSAAGCDSIVTLTLTVKSTVTGAQSVTICNNQLPYNWNGNIYNAAGTYKDTLVSAAGCDSIVTLTLTVKPNVTGSQTVTICNNQLPYNWNGNIYNVAGTYKDTLISAAGCDSIITLTLTVKSSVTGAQAVTICNNQLPYTWNGNIYNAAGTYKDTLISATGCDSIVTLTLTVKTAVTGAQAVTICTNQLPYLWNGNTYNAAGTYKDTLISASGCDSIVTLTLTVKTSVTGAQAVIICNNQLPYTWNSNIYNAAGTYKDTLVSSSGCDSIVTLTLTIKPAVTGAQAVTICNNQLPYTWNGNIFNAAGTYKDTLISASGCDSIVTLTLTVTTSVTATQAVTICTNQLPYNWNGNTYNTAGTYKDTLINASGCDSIITLTLTVTTSVSGAQAATICANQLPYTWNGNTYIAAGTYKDTLTSAAGCDSIVTLTLTVSTSVTGTQTVTICNNQLPYTWNGNIYNAAGTYKDTLISSVSCDSIVTLTLTVTTSVTGAQAVTICSNQLPYNWNGNIYNAAGTYKDTLISAAGCDSIVTLTLTVTTSVTGAQAVTICSNQLPYNWNGNIYNSAGTYKDTLVSAAGCDSIVTLTLTVKPTVTGAQTVTICNNQLPYNWNGNTYNAAGTYKDTLINAAGCDSIVTLTLTVTTSVTGSQTFTICNNQLPYTWNGNIYNAAGTYKDTLISTSGCDSIVTLTLTVKPAVTGAQAIAICNNQLPYTWNGNIYNTAGAYKDTLISTAGCDSIVTLTLTVKPIVTVAQAVAICNNQLPYTWNGNIYNIAGTYKDTLISAAGCDSIVTLTLTVNSSLTGAESVTICNNQLPYTWNGNIYNAAGTYKDTLISAAGCDSIVTLTLIVNSSLTGAQAVTICNNQLPYSWNGNIYNAAGTYKDTLTSAAGCDSIVTLTLTVKSAVTGAQAITICNNQLPYTWNGNTYNTAGTYKDTLVSTSGCDSIVTLTLTIKTAVTGAQAVSICNNQLPYTWNGNTYNTAGTYKDTLVSAAGCDSIVTLTLTVKSAVTGAQAVTICNNQLPYTWNGNIYNAAGTYKDTLASAAGCDSIVTLTLTVNTSVTGTQSVTICNNQLPYTWNGNTYNAAGTYQDTLTSAAGCDSIVTLTLTVTTVVTGTQSVTICNNLLPYTWNGNIYNAAGTYKDTLPSAAGCDSIVTLTLTVNSSVTGIQTVTICNNQLPYTWNGNQYNGAGTYKDTLISAAGCDSIVTLTLTVNSSVTGTQTVSICNNQLPYTWNGNTYNAAGTYKDTLISAAGCDSIVTLTLTVSTSVTGTQAVSICNNQLPYTWNGNIYNVAGTYKDTLISTAGCDSIVTLTLTVNPAVTATQSVTICNNQLPYTWNGNIYNIAGTYKDTLISAAGCDSIVTLTLTVKPAVTGAQAATICANQLPYTWNGNAYNTAGTYKDTLISASGCDSIVTLTLTVNTSLTGTQAATICNNQLPYTWNGNIYNAAGTYQDTLTSAAGCDSIVTLTLTVNTSVTGTQTMTICANQLPYAWNGNIYNAAGTYKDTLISAAGCDSIVTLTLTVNTSVTGTQAVTICNNLLPYTWNGNTYNTAGTYKDTLTSAAGCDSIITLLLTVKSSFAKSENISTCATSYKLPNGVIANASGVYKSSFTTQSGCDSIITTNLTLQPSPNLIVNNPVPNCNQTTIDLTAQTITAGSDAGLNFTYWTDSGATRPQPAPNAINVSGMYYIKATNTAGCSNIKPVTAQLNRAPTATISSSDVCMGAKTNLTITLSGKAPFNITWSDGNVSHTIVGITSSTYQIEVSPTTNTTYSITNVSDAVCSNNSVNTSAAVNIIKPPAAIRYPEVITSVNVPTPLKARTLGNNYAYKWTPSTGLSKPDVINPVFNYSQRMDYLIIITSDRGCMVVDTQSVKVIARTNVNEPPNLWVPTAWSPHNKDGHNDYLYPFTVNIVELRYFRVFNRWGELVFETRELGKGWDGIYKGVPQVMDTYTWTVEAVGNDGTIFKKAGNAMLLR
jgi:gliding motility-associated-like protein